MKKWKTNMNNLLIYVCLPQQEQYFRCKPVLTSAKAALFTAIVTAFVLDAMSELDEDTATKLLRLSVEQSAKNSNSTIEMPPSDPPSSILTVSSLWFMSIMSSLAATAWAILCLEWCAFITDAVKAEDHEEMVEKRQRRFEAMKRWKMHFIVAAIPLFLHLSLFLFLGGLWLRLRDINEHLGLIVGVPSLVIGLSYVVVTLLPIFTEAPFSTSASELIQPVVDRIRRIVEFGGSIRPPPIFTRIANLLPASFWTTISWLATHFPRPGMCRLIASLKRIYGVVGMHIVVSWKTIASLPIFPRFGSDQNPFNELNKLKVGHSGRDQGIYLRALFWLMNTPLDKDEVKEVLKEFESLRSSPAKEPLDRAIIRLLVLSLSSVLENDYISEGEQPIFNYCTAVLANEMDRAFGDGEYNRKILFRNTTLFGKLSRHFHLTTSNEDAPSTQPTAYREEDYWSRAFPALWLCPSTETVQSVVKQLDSDMQAMKVPHQPQRIVRGLHAATLGYSHSDLSPLDLIPGFGLWSWDPNSSDPSLDKALSSFLQGLFAAFFNTLPRSDQPTTTPLLVVETLKILDHQPEQYTLKLHTALGFFVAVMRRSDPKVFEERPSVAEALLASAESYGEFSGESGTIRAKVLATRLRAIAYGPKSPITGRIRSLKRLGDLYAHVIKEDQRFFEGLLDAYAATLEATLAVDGHLTIFAWLSSPDYGAARDIFTNSLFTRDASFNFVREHPNYRLPYVYSLAIALSYTAEGRNLKLWKVVDLFVTRGEQGGMTIDRALDTNILVAAVLKFALCNESETVEQEQKEKILGLLRNIVMDGTNWRTGWKSIYLIMGLVFVLSRMDNQYAKYEQTKFLVDEASKRLQRMALQPVPSDWERKKKGLALCDLEKTVRSRASTRGGKAVYEWSSRENFPYLALYNPPRTSPEPISQAAYWVVTKLPRYVSISDWRIVLVTRSQVRPQ